MGKEMPMFRNVFDGNYQREIKSIDNVFGNFLVTAGLYEEIEITEENIYELADLVGGHVKINVYCTKCRESRVFACEAISYYWYDEQNDEILCRSLEDEIVSWQRIQKINRTPNPFSTSSLSIETTWVWINNFINDDTRLMVFKFFCAMDNNHHLDYVVITEGNVMRKIGQFPSVADLECPELKEYRKVISREDEKELKRAIGLFASGIGVGSFVYLRRIFERIIVSASQKALEEEKIVEEEFAKARIDEKIKMLVDYLPRSMVGNSVFYGIISKGIHELSEEECLDYFPILKNFIVMTLRQWETLRKDKEEEIEISKALNKIASKV